MKIDDSFNYSMYKQLGSIKRNHTYDLLLDGMSLTTNVGEYRKERQFSYASTEFYKFDKFLFATWTEKEKLEWGNAVK